MGTEDSLKFCNSSNSGHGSEVYDPFESCVEVNNSDSQPPDSQVIDEAPETIVDGLPESVDTLVNTTFEKRPENGVITPLPVGIEFEKSVIPEHTENGSLAVQSKSGFEHHEEDGTLVTKRQRDASLFSGIKRPRIAVDEHQQPSVHVVYNFLTSESKQKLDELLQQWSRLHSQSCSLSDDLNATLESGEKTYFPALRIGSDKLSDVTFWVDNLTRTQLDKEIIPLGGTLVPLYDRGYSLALTSADGSCKTNRGVEKLDSFRCFNCGSYNHGLKDCPKPRDNVAVNNAWKEHKAKRNQHTNSRNSIRYYQSSLGGKYDGLAPGGLDVDTRRALGLGELDPPPWLNRMREIGYPPGYLGQDVDDQPSGITIFGDVEIEKETEGVRILDASFTEPSRKMTVEFPGINAPIPENADEGLWAPPTSSRFNQSRENSHHRVYNHLSDNRSHWHNIEQRSDRFLEDDGPPGCDPRLSPSLSNHFRRYGDRDFGDYSHSPQANPSEPWSSSYGKTYSDNSRNPSEPWSSSYGRTYSDNGRRSPLVHDSFGSPSSNYIPIPRYGDNSSPRYGNREYGYSARSPRASPLMPWSPSYGRSYLERGSRSPRFYRGSPNDGSYGRSPYLSPR